MDVEHLVELLRAEKQDLAAQKTELFNVSIIQPSFPHLSGSDILSACRVSCFLFAVIAAACYIPRLIEERLLSSNYTLYLESLDVLYSRIMCYQFVIS